MLDIKQNIEELRKIILEDNFKQEEAIEFLDAIFENAEQLESDLKDSEKEVEGLQSELDDIDEDAYDEAETTNATINCGIGTIEYAEPDNLQLQSVMDNLDAAIQKNGARKVATLLESTY